MPRLSTIVVGTDGSDAATEAVQWAADHIGDGQLHVVFAGHGRARADDQDELEWMLAGAWTDPIRQAGIDATRHVLEGEPAAALVEAADTVGADAIVVGAHGSGSKPSHHLGSITRKLLHESTRPVIVVAPPSAAHTTADAQRVIVCVGYGDTAARAAQWGAAYAADSGLDLTLLHVVTHRPLFPLDSPVDMVGSYLGSDVSHDWAQSELDGLRDELLTRHPDLEISTRIEHGTAVESILDASHSAELVVVGKRHEGVVSRHLIGPRLQRLLARGASPTAVVPSCVTTD